VTPVVIEVVPPEAPPALVKELVDSCSASLGNGACRTTDSTGGPADRAIVHWEDPDSLHASVEVGVGKPGDRSWEQRGLVFKDADTSTERWRAMGLTVAALVAERQASIHRRGEDSKDGPNPSVLPGASVQTPQGPLPARRSPRSPRSSSMWIGVAGTLGPALDLGSPRMGGRLDAAWRPSAWPFFARVALGYAARPTDGRNLFVDWKVATLMVGTTLGNGFVTVEPRLGGGVDVARAEASSVRRSESKSRVATGLFAGLDAVLHLGRFGVVASGDAWHLDSRTTILVGGEDAGIAGQNGWALGLGVRAYFPGEPSP
jgi:hypothetical protein